jgi:hypothetical protein
MWIRMTQTQLRENTTTSLASIQINQFGYTQTVFSLSNCAILQCQRTGLYDCWLIPVKVIIECANSWQLVGVDFVFLINACVIPWIPLLCDEALAVFVRVILVDRIQIWLPVDAAHVKKCVAQWDGGGVLDRMGKGVAWKWSGDKLDELFLLIVHNVPKLKPKLYIYFLPSGRRPRNLFFMHDTNEGELVTVISSPCTNSLFIKYDSSFFLSRRLVCSLLRICFQIKSLHVWQTVEDFSKSGGRRSKNIWNQQEQSYDYFCWNKLNF